MFGMPLAFPAAQRTQQRPTSACCAFIWQVCLKSPYNEERVRSAALRGEWNSGGGSKDVALFLSKIPTALNAKIWMEGQARRRAALVLGRYSLTVPVPRPREHFQSSQTACLVFIYRTSLLTCALLWQRGLGTVLATRVAVTHFTGRATPGTELARSLMACC